MKLDRDQYWAFCHLGYLLYRRGRPARGARVFEGLTAMYPNRAYPWIGLGACKREMGRPNESAQAFQKALEAAPDSIRARVALAELLHEHGANSDARAVLEPVANASSDDDLVGRAHALLRRWTR